MHNRTLLAAAMVSFSLFASTGASAATACDDNFTVEGSFFKGKQFKTWAESPGVTYDAAFRKVAQAIAAGGYGAVSSSKDTGIITAGQAVTMGSGSVAPLNAIVEERPGGVIRVSMTFSIAGGQTASADTAKSELCRIASAPAS